MKKQMTILGATLALGATSQAGWALDRVQPYIGASYVYSSVDDVKIAGADIDLGELEDFDPDEFDDSRSTGKAVAGVQITPWLGVEAQYIYLGEYEQSGFTIDGDAYGAAATLTLPLGDYVGLFVKGGQLWWDVDVEGPGPLDASRDGSNIFYGVGADFILHEHFVIRTEYERIPIDKDEFEANIDLLSLGLQFRF
ncbi:MAG: porin family protein [Pseudomonadota bacterium]|nr:porin family protein [Pseudomonadota bacterium]